jgi:predicted nucleic acid-binding protein
MDLADASLVAAADTLRLDRVFTLDRHFHAYRRFDTQPFTVLP